jgi:hypothetical protein
VAVLPVQVLAQNAAVAVPTQHLTQSHLTVVVAAVKEPLLA